MFRAVQLITLFVLVTFATAQVLKSKNAKKYNPDDVQTPPSLVTILQSPDAAPPSLPVNLELPREEAPNVAFYNPDAEPGTYTVLQPPAVAYYGQNPNIYNSDYPVPSQDLQVPAAEPWNPDNDPKFYYELPSVVTKQEVPTNLYPKKYNKDVYEKQKSSLGRPKQEVSLIPISEQEYMNKQEKINKVLLNLAKVQNQKDIEVEKVQKSAKKISLKDKEPQAAASGFSQGFHAEGGITGDGGLLPAPAALLHSSHGASAEFHEPPAPGKRLEFQMHGHDGPYSYKWGYDTGKGHNRQFRYEERDKHGYVKGHYGYYDKHGKLRMVHYDAHPHEGFHAEGNFGSN